MLSAVEGLSVSAPMLAHWAVPISVVILTALFSIQRHGTGKVGVLFGPVVLLWFLTLAPVGRTRLVGAPAGAVVAESGGGVAVSRS